MVGLTVKMAVGTTITESSDQDVAGVFGGKERGLDFGCSLKATVLAVVQGVPVMADEML